MAMSEPATLDRCTGHCCRRLTIPMSPEWLERNAEFSRAHDAHKRDPRAHPDPELDPYFEGAKLYHEIDVLASMLEPIGYEPAGEGFEIHGFPPEYKRWWYRCRNLQSNGDCGIYDNRPLMCRSYPDKRRCRYKACTWREARALPLFLPGDEEALHSLTDREGITTTTGKT